MDKTDFYLRQAYKSNKKMPRYSSNTGCGGLIAAIIGFFGVITIQLGVWAGLAALLGIWTDRNLDFWVSHYKGVPTDIPFLLSWLASLPLPITFVANIIAEIARFAI